MAPRQIITLRIMNYEQIFWGRLTILEIPIIFMFLILRSDWAGVRLCDCIALRAFWPSFAWDIFDNLQKFRNVDWR